MKIKFKITKKIICFIIGLTLFFAMSYTVSSHPGRTDANGGHYDRKTGQYHYHNGGSSSGSSSSNSTYTGPTYASKVNAVSVPSSINAGESTTLKAKAYPENAEDSNITWSSETPDIAKVSASGELTAVGIGTAIIVAKTSRGTSNKFTINVKEIIAETIKVKDKPFEIFIGEEKQLDVMFAPENTTYKDVEWISSDNAVATVNESGKIKAVSIGKTTITVKHKELADSFEIEVKPILAKSVKIELVDDIETEKEKFVKIKVGNTISFKASILPYDTTYKTVKWSIDNNSIAEIDENGVLKGVTNGTVTVKAKTENGIEDTFEVEVYETLIADVIIGIIAFVICLGLIAGIIVLIVYLVKKRKK